MVDDNGNGLIRQSPSRLSRSPFQRTSKIGDDNVNGRIGQFPSRQNDSNQQTETLFTSSKPHIAAPICAAICTALVTGSILGSSSSAQNQYVFTGPANQTNIGSVLDEEQWSWVVSTVPIGAIVGALIIGFVIARFGGKMAMFATSMPSIVGWPLVCWPNNVGALIVGRLLLGISIGFVYVVVPIYISEISETMGRFGIFFYLMCTIGIVFANIFGHHLAYNIICAVMSIVSVVAFNYMPEWPTYSVNQDRSDDATKSRHNTENNRTPIWSRIKKVVALKEFRVICGLMLLQQMSGINGVIFYNEFIVNTAHGNINNDAVIISTVHVVVTFAASWVVDKCGHRILLTTSIAIMALCEFLLCIYFSVYIPNSMHFAINWAWCQLPIFCLYISAYSLGLGPIPWLMVVNLLPDDTKVIGVSAAVAVNWGIASVVVKLFVSIGIGLSFLISGIFSIFVGIVFIYRKVPKSETKGNSLAEERTMSNGSSSTTVLSEED